MKIYKWELIDWQTVPWWFWCFWHCRDYLEEFITGDRKDTWTDRIICVGLIQTHWRKAGEDENVSN